MKKPARIVKKSLFKVTGEDFSQKIGLISIGVSLLIIVLIMSLFFLYIKQKRQKGLIEDGIALTEIIANYSVKGLDKIDADAIIKSVEIMGRKSGLVFGMIMDVSGRVITHTNISYIDHELTDPVTSRAISSNNPLKQVYKDPQTDNEMYEFSRPLYQGGEKSGVVRLGFSLDANPLYSDNDIRGLLLIATLIFSLVPIFYYLVRRALGSLETLNNELKNLLTRDNIKKIEVSSNDATGKLVDRFNQAISRIQEEHDTLKVSHNDLDVSNKVLTYEKERIESVVDNISDGILVTDSVGNIILVNRAMAFLLGFSGQDIIGKTIDECLDNEKILSFIKKNQSSGTAFSQKNMELSLKQFGADSIVIISYMPLLSREESVLGNIITARDITAEKMARQNQSEFIAHVSHELRTPLTTIKSYVEMLMDDEINSRETKIDFFNTINQETDRLARLIGNLLNITKIEMGNIVIEKDLVKTREFFEDIIKSIESQSMSKKIKLETSLPEKLSSLVMEKDLLRIAILNILGNAIKYTPAEGTITFNVEEGDDSVKVEITDTGYGISEEELPLIFDKFFRSPDENIKKQTGNGLGLALSREIIRLHEGRIEVTSTIDQGSHFTVTLPREENPRIRSYSGSYSSLVDLK